MFAFDIEENTIIEAFVRFRFASVAITSTDADPDMRQTFSLDADPELGLFFVTRSG